LNGLHVQQRLLSLSVTKIYGMTIDEQRGLGIDVNSWI